MRSMRTPPLVFYLGGRRAGLAVEPAVLDIESLRPASTSYQQRSSTRPSVRDDENAIEYCSLYCLPRARQATM